MSNFKAPQTIAAANGIAVDDSFGAVVAPIYLSSTFAFAGFERPRGHEYTRASNPSRDLLADTIAKLEGGAGAVMLASGMAAVDLVLSRLNPDELVIAPHDCYGGTYRLLSARRDRGQFEVSFIDQGDEAALSAAIKRKPALVLIESPSNRSCASSISGP
jgi:cystathionine gamma-synthase